MPGLTDVSFAVATLSVDTISVARRTRTINANGVMVLGSPTITSARASVQPAGTDVLDGLRVQQGIAAQKLEGAIVAFTLDQLVAAEGVNQSDEVTWHGTLYTVLRSEDWSQSGYWRSICLKKEP
jgi:hypothetical protein